MCFTLHDLRLEIIMLESGTNLQDYLPSIMRAEPEGGRQIVLNYLILVNKISVGGGRELGG